MEENKTNVENFFASSITDRFRKEIVLNLRQDSGGILLIDVYVKKYFSKNKRTSSFILGTFVKKQFHLLNISQRNKNKTYRQTVKMKLI